MIITQQKPLEEILKMLEPFSKVFIIGCGTCSTVCQTGGEEQVEQMAETLKKEGKEVTGSVVVEAPCDARLLRRDTRKMKKAIEESEALLCMTCGAGVQDIVQHLKKISVPALNTKFLGQIERIGEFYERCRACGECILYETGGICPIVRCPKGMMNGPCGGMFEGKCEVGGYQRDCAWVLIYNRLKELGMLDLYKSYKPPRDNSQLNIQPREIVLVKTRR
ncbi:5,10-methylenetetrahydrofolate reductase [Candidatus Bathyarchaeota archaeon ex4484_231]|nr:MAG: 5,10-methylenetetrahydrofolate reductase [Candidatus Bathyarchaeota archaeon ex4484_231]RJS75063.1 MAG: 5,10-methylenetetrahydrofolate reductase [Candidatus Bathyarchaeota archaeon]